MFNIIKNNILVNYGILLVEMPVSVYELNIFSRIYKNSK